LQLDNDLIKKTIEENRMKTLFRETVKEESTEVNENLTDLQKKLFYAPIKIHKAKSDHIKLGLQVKEMQEKYQKAQEAHSMIIEWKDSNQSSPDTLLVYSYK
jgi:hypothetical protein